ncbi:MAG: hypothetical protein RL297_2127 [Pseudomonadota bacterium]|jgi:hypothetical protein
MPIVGGTVQPMREAELMCIMYRSFHAVSICLLMHEHTEFMLFHYMPP